MKKFFSLVLALVMALSLTTVAWGATVDAAALAAAAATGGTVNLDQNIELTGPITVKENLVVNLNGYTISSPGVYGVDPAGDEGVFIIENASAGVSLTINGNDKATSKITTGDIAVWSKGNGTSANTIVLNGVKIESNYFGVYHNGSNYGADVTIENSTITDNFGAGVFLSGSKNWASNQMNKLTIINSTVEGASSAVEVKYADVVVTNSTLEATATGTATMEFNGNGRNTVGYALALTHSGADGSAEDATGSITVNGGNIVGAVGIQESGGGGAGTAAAEVANTADATIAVKGGTFTDDVSDYLAAGYVQGGDGSVVTPVAQVGNTKYATVAEAIAAANGAPVILLDSSATIPAGYSYSSLTGELYRAAENHYSTTNPSVSGTTSTGKNTYKLYSADGKTEHTIVGDVTFTSAAGQTVTNGVVTAGTVDYYTVNTTKLVVTDAACAEYRLVKNGSVIFVARMNNTYSATVKPYELVAFGCAKEALKNASDIVYVKTNLTATELPTYYVESKDGTVQGLLANGSIVKMVAVTKADVVTAGTHTWDKTTVVYNASTGVVTSVTCKVCGAKAICAKVLPVGYELKQITMDAAVVATPANYVWYVDGVVTNTPAVVPSVPSTDKVTSAETFDAGIAMYVGMSVMAAAGSAVVIGKKKG